MKKFRFSRSIFVVSPFLLFNPDALAVECSLSAASSHITDTSFKVEYTVTNNKSQPTSQWSVQLGQVNGSIQSNWESVLLSTSAPVTLGNAPWNGVLQPGASVKFGLAGSNVGSFAFPDCVDAAIANMAVPVFDDPSPVETTLSGGFFWQPVPDAAHYEIEQHRLDDNGESIELLSSFTTTSTTWGFMNSDIGHFGWRLRQCDADGNCSAFTDFKRYVKYSLETRSLNTVTGTYTVSWKSPFANSVLLENGQPVANAVAGATGSFSFRDRESGTYVYSLSTQTSNIEVEISRFDTEIDKDRSLLVHDQATLNAANISLAEVFDIFAQQLVAENPADPIDGNTLFARMWDAQNSADTSLNTGAIPCTTTHLGDPVDCRRTEADQAADPALFLSRYIPTAMVNRLDLRDRAQHEHCGEVRMIFALPQSLGGRNLLIFEAEMANPQPGNEQGCQPIAQFWHELSSIDSAAERGQKLRDFYLTGLPAAGVGPVFHIDNFTDENGQVRTNQFRDTAQGWNLKEYKISTENNFSTLKIVTVKNNPMASFFDMRNDPEFMRQFSNNVLSLVGGLSFISMPPYDDRFNNIESHANGSITENLFLPPFEFSKGSEFEDRILVSLDNVRSDLTVTQVINRAVAMTCGGCHQPQAFGLTAPDAVGPGQSWPRSAFFVHVNETAAGGIFPLSPALNDVFLPDRLEVFETYLSTGVQPAPVEPVADPDEATESQAINNGDRSG